VIVTNKSRRPITRITSRIVKKADGAMTVPDESGFSPCGGDEDSQNRDTLISIEPNQEFAFLRRTLSCGFRFSDVPIDPDRHVMVARFWDDAGIPWQLDGGGHLARTPKGGEIMYKK
jgi:hypothetical protein